MPRHNRGFGSASLWQTFPSVRTIDVAVPEDGHTPRKFGRPAERRAGKEGRSRVSTYHYKKTHAKAQSRFWQRIAMANILIRQNNRRCCARGRAHSAKVRAAAVPGRSNVGEHVRVDVIRQVISCQGTIAVLAAHRYGKHSHPSEQSTLLCPRTGTLRESSGCGRPRPQQCRRTRAWGGITAGKLMPRYKRGVSTATPRE